MHTAPGRLVSLPGRAVRSNHQYSFSPVITESNVKPILYYNGPSSHLKSMDKVQKMALFDANKDLSTTVNHHHS